MNSGDRARRAPNGRAARARAGGEPGSARRLFSPRSALPGSHSPGGAFETQTPSPCPTFSPGGVTKRRNVCGDGGFETRPHGFSPRPIRTQTVSTPTRAVPWGRLLDAALYGVASLSMLALAFA